MSLQAHVFNWIIRWQMRRAGGGSGDTVDVDRIRAMFDAAPVKVPKGVMCEPGSIAGIEGEWVRALDVPPRKRLLYIHGGAFVACSARTHRVITGAFARRGFEVFAPNYRLAPEHPFPAGLDDLVAVWRAFAANERAALAGDSAGGTLALALMLQARAMSLPLPSATALFSPATDLLATGQSLDTNARRDPMLNRHALQKLLPLYAGDHDPGEPLLSPLYADFTGFTPLLIHVGEREILRDDALRLAQRARAAGVTVALRVYPVVPHVWQVAGSILPEARHSLDAASVFLHGETAAA